MPQSQQPWNPVEEFKQKYPNSGYSDQEIYKNLTTPSMFRSAFPDYAHLGDGEIKTGLGQFASKYAPSSGTSSGMDDALAKLNTHSGSGFWERAHDIFSPSPAPKVAKNPYATDVSIPEQLERAKNRDYGQTSMSAGGPAPAPPEDAYAVKPNTLNSFLTEAGIPTNQPAAHDAVVGMLTPKANPNHGPIARVAERLPLVGSDFRARHELADKGEVLNAAVPFAGPAASEMDRKLAEKDYTGAAGAGVNAFLSLIGLKGAVTPKPRVGLSPAGEMNLAPKPSPPGELVEHPNAATSGQTENLNSLRPGRSTSINMEGTDQAATSVRNAAAKLTGKEGAADLKFKRTIGDRLTGSNKGVQNQIRMAEQVPKAAQEALNDHETVIQRITSPYENAVVSTQPAADAVRAQITPELLDAAKKNPKVAGLVQDLQQLAAENEGSHSIRDINARRMRYNDDLAPLYDKTQQGQAEAPAVMQAKKAAVEALRDVQYNTISDLSGTDIRPLKQKEGALIDYKADVNKRLAQAANSRANVQPGYGGRVKRALSKTNPTKESSTLDLAKTVLGGRDVTPIEDFNATASRGLSNLAPYQQPNMPPIPHEVESLIGTQEPLPTIRGPLFDLSQTPYEKPQSHSAASFIDPSLLEPGTGPAKGGHSPYKTDQSVAAHVSPEDRAAMEGAEFGGFRVGSDETPNYGRTRRPLVTEEHPEMGAQLPDVIAEAAGFNKPAPKALPPARSIQLGPSSLEVSGGSSSTAPAPVNDRSAGLAARKGASVIPERGQNFKTNEQVERRALPRSTQAQLYTSELNEIRRDIRDSATPEEKRYNEQRLIMKQEELSKISGHNSVQNGSLEELSRGKTLKVNPKTGKTSVTGGNIDMNGAEAIIRKKPNGSLEVLNNNTGLPDDAVLAQFAPTTKEVFNPEGGGTKGLAVYKDVAKFVQGRDTIGLTDLKEKFGFSSSEAIDMLDKLESNGVVKPSSGTGPRKVNKKK